MDIRDYDHCKLSIGIMRFAFRLLWVVAASQTLLAGPSHAGPGLVISPQRVVLAGRDREASITIANTGDETGAFRLFFLNYRMTETGAFEPVTTPENGAPFLGPLARFSPRQAILAPGQSQSVRIVVLRTPDLPLGEYRSHLVFQNVPRKGTEKDITSNKGRTRAAVKSLYGISIPIIFRNKTRPATIEIEDARFYADAASRPVLEIAALRTGDESTYGDLRVTLRPNGEKAFKPFLESNGNAIYPPLRRRTFLVPSPPKPNGGTLRIEYLGPNRVLATKDIEVR